MIPTCIIRQLPVLEPQLQLSLYWAQIIAFLHFCRNSPCLRASCRHVLPNWSAKLQKYSRKEELVVINDDMSGKVRRNPSSVGDFGRRIDAIVCPLLETHLHGELVGKIRVVGVATKSFGDKYIVPEIDVGGLLVVVILVRPKPSL